MIEINQIYERTFMVDDSKVKKFAEVSEDVNPLHLDEDYAKKTKFGQRIAHGMLGGGFISATIAEKWPGAIYLEQNLWFQKPVFLDKNVIVELHVVDQQSNNRWMVMTKVYQDNEKVISGYAILLIN